MHDVQLLTSCEVQDGATGSPEGPIDPSVLEGHLHIKTCFDCRLCLTPFLGHWLLFGGKYEWLMIYSLTQVRRFDILLVNKKVSRGKQVRKYNATKSENCGNPQ